jgi:hypothetical protein
MKVVLRPNAKTVKIKEQVINDLATGLTLIFEVTPSGEEARVRLIGPALPFGNRDFQFNKEGELVGAGTGLSGCGFYEADEVLHNEV